MGAVFTKAQWAGFLGCHHEKVGPAVPQACRPRRGHRGEAARHQRHRPDLPDPRAQDPRAAWCREPPTTTDHVARNADAALARARLRAPTFPGCLGCRPKLIGSPLPRRSGSSGTSFPNGSTGARSGAFGASFRSGCPSRWTRSAPSSPTPTWATTPRRRSDRGARSTATSGSCSGTWATRSKWWRSSGNGRSRGGRGRCSPTGRGIRARPKSTRRSGATSTGSSRRSSEGMSTPSTNTAACRPL